MSRYFELTDEHGHDSEAQPLVRTAPTFKPSLPNRYTQRAVHALEEMFLAGLWRIVRNRKWIITAFAVVVMVVTASLLMKPRYDAVGRVLFYREDGGWCIGVQGANPPLPEDPDDRAAIDTQIGILQTDGLASAGHSFLNEFIGTGYM